MASGCGNTLYAIDANSAASKLEEAKELGAEKLAPFTMPLTLGAWAAQEREQESARIMRCVRIIRVV